MNLRKIIRNEPIWLLMLRLFVLTYYPANFLFAVVESFASHTIRMALMVISFGWFLPFLVFLPIFLFAEMGGLIAVLLKPSWTSALGTIKWHLYSLAFAGVTYIFYLTNKMMIW